MKAIITAGPTFEPIDPVRFIGNRSSGKQGYAIAEALAQNGFDVTLISGPTALNDPEGVKTIRIETAAEMLASTLENLPADIAVCTAAVSDWRPATTRNSKIKKDGSPPSIDLTENPDILHTIATHENRPKLVIGFAAETENLLENATSKQKRKNCDWILANLAGHPDQKTFGEDENHVYLITQNSTDDWGRSSKVNIAERLALKAMEHLKNHE